MRLAISISACLLVAASAAQGQVCRGYAPFSSGPVVTSGSYTMAKSAKAYSYEVGYGSVQSGFASIDYDRVSPDTPAGASSSGNGIAVSGGTQMRLSPLGSAQFCPVAGLGYSSGSYSSSAVSSSATAISYHFGGAIGTAISAGSAVRFIPAATVEYVGSRSNGNVTLNGSTNTFRGQTFSTGLLAPTIGASFFDRATVAVFDQITFGGSRGGASWGVLFRLNFGQTSK